MIENITFKDCKINSVILQNDTPVNISNNGSEIGSLNVDSLGDNPTKSFISLIGNFSGTDIILTSDCNINCEQGFISNKPITISPQFPIYIILSGNFSNCAGLIITGPCSIITASDTNFKPNFNISISVKEDMETKNVSINGNFSECNLNVNTYCNLNLEGSFRSLNIGSGIQNQTLFIEANTKILSVNIASLLSVSGNQDSITNLQNNVLNNHNNIIISSISQIVLTNNLGIGKANLNIKKSGQYKIVASISLPNKDVQIGDVLIVNVP